MTWSLNFKVTVDVCSFILRFVPPFSVIDSKPWTSFWKEEHMLFSKGDRMSQKES